MLWANFLQHKVLKGNNHGRVCVPVACFAGFPFCVFAVVFFSGVFLRVFAGFFPRVLAVVLAFRGVFVPSVFSVFLLVCLSVVSRWFLRGGGCMLVSFWRGVVLRSVAGFPVFRLFVCGGCFPVCRFVLAVSPSGVCSFRSRRSFRVLSGGAVVSCSRSVLRSVRSSLSSSRRSLVGRVLSARRSAWRVRARRFPLVLVPCPRVPGCLWSVAPSVSLGRALSAWSVPLLPLSPVFSGSVLFLFSPAFLRRVRGGACPVSVCLSAFPRYCVRSALLWCLWRVFSSPRSFVVPSRPLSVLLSVGLRSLGFSGVPFSGGLLSPSACSFLRSFPVPALPVGVSFGVSFRVSSVVSGVCRLSSSLSWLSRGSRGGCPVALRPLLALVLRCVALRGCFVSAPCASVCPPAGL